MHFSFEAARNKHDYYSGEDCMKIFCKDACSKENKLCKKEMAPLTNEENISCRNQKICCIRKK